MTEHTVKAFTEELDALTHDVARMGGFAETAVNEAIAAVVRRDTLLAQAVMERDARIDAVQREVEKRAIQPLCAPPADRQRSARGADRLAHRG